LRASSESRKKKEYGRASPEKKIEEKMLWRARPRRRKKQVQVMAGFARIPDDPAFFWKKESGAKKTSARWPKAIWRGSQDGWSK
jgi:hypothetical protein